MDTCEPNVPTTAIVRVSSNSPGVSASGKISSGVSPCSTSYLPPGIGAIINRSQVALPVPWAFFPAFSSRVTSSAKLRPSSRRATSPSPTVA